ncbi:hypothetical protein UCDDA912_g04730 [Diaporthe ampelina]|uniref:Uncharacterized protein n=1 Tax=Diaporthe ampelina TaxID=1214573 RepID=A0A0G2I606_9PEZI|nr:hypothetical protein UCDDA912_g04730 [Diaporthe ampelina]
MDAPMMWSEEEHGFLDVFDGLVAEDPDGEQVVAHLKNGPVSVAGQLGEMTSPNDGSFNPYEEAYPIGPLVTASKAQTGAPIGVANTVPPSAAIHQPIIHQPAAQQSQQTIPATRSCPVQGCNSIQANTRMDHLWDHLAEAHGYERMANEYTIVDRHLKRKTVSVVRGLLVRDTRKLAWIKARLRAVDEDISRHSQSYVSRHGLGLTMQQHSIPQANACKKPRLITMLKLVRNEMKQKGSLYNQPSQAQAQSTWEEVYENLVSTFQLDQVAERAVLQRAEQYFNNLRAFMGDDMNEAVPPARVELTDELVLKPGASLPPK